MADGRGQRDNGAGPPRAALQAPSAAQEAAHGILEWRAQLLTRARAREILSAGTLLLGALLFALVVVLGTVLGAAIGLPNATLIIALGMALGRGMGGLSKGPRQLSSPESERIANIKSISAAQDEALAKFVRQAADDASLPPPIAAFVATLRREIVTADIAALQALKAPAAASELPAPAEVPALPTRSPTPAPTADDSALDLGTAQDLLDRLLAKPHDVVYLVGSAVTAPIGAGKPGVPRTDDIVALIRAEYPDDRELLRLEESLAAEPDNQYQAAFRHLLKTRDQDTANAVIRRAVLSARQRSTRFPSIPTDAVDPRLCQQLEDDLEGWHLPPAAEALGRVLAHERSGARPVVLTSNFDPLVTIAVRRAGGPAYTAAFHRDGSFAGVDGPGCKVVHFHGHWFHTDTLHTPSQLGQERPMLSASLAQLISARTLVVLGYSGRDDVFTRSLVALIRGGLAPLKVAWAFHAADEATITTRSRRQLETLRPGIDAGRIRLYKGIDVHTFLPELAAHLGRPGA